MPGQLQEYTNIRIVITDEDLLGFDNTHKVDEHFVLAIKEVAAGLEREEDTTGETERDDSTIHTTPSSPIFMLENMYNIDGSSTSKDTAG